jgi:uncharacterized membrane protein YccC
VSWLSPRRGDLIRVARIVIAAAISFGLAHWMALPQGYWAVLASVIVMQASVGGSLKATGEQILGALAGGICGIAAVLLIPHGTFVTLAIALAAALAPAALLSLLNPRFRVAPVTAIIVLLGSVSQTAGPVLSVAERLAEIALGGAVAIVVSLFILPARAHTVLTAIAGEMVDMLAEVVPSLFEGATGETDQNAIDERFFTMRASLTRLETATDEALRERRSHLTDAPDPEPFQRTLLRLRHDLVMIRRAIATPLPPAVIPRLREPLADLSNEITAFMRATGAALSARQAPPPIEPINRAIESYDAAITALREGGATRLLSVDDVGRLFALGFAFDQLRDHLVDLMNRTAESARQT